MKLKTFTATKMSEALALVKKDLGPGAVILHTRTYKQGGILGLGARTVVEITASDTAPGREPRRPARRPTPPPTRTALTAPPPPSLPAPPPDSERAGDLIRRTYAAAKSEFAAKHAAAPVAIAPVAPPSDQLTEEMRAIKRMVARMLHQQKVREAAAVLPGVRTVGAGSASARSAAVDPCQPGVVATPDKLFDQYLALLEQEVSEELADEVVQHVRATLRPEHCQNDAAVRQAVLEAVARLIPVDGGAGQLQPTADGRPRTIALVGPTGVGKTTTIAKLAANFKLKQKRSVGLITLDTYRIAAVDQLRTYANIIGVPLHVVQSPAELLDATARCSRCDVVLIDTAGRSQRDDPKLDQLSSLVTAARPHEVHLVLSSTCTQRVLMDTVERFGRIRTDQIIFTKLDEAVSFGVLLNVARKVKKRLSYITTGQEVPHQIEASSPRRIAELVVGDKPLVASGSR